MAYVESTGELYGRGPRARLRAAALSALGAAGSATGRVSRALERPRVHFIYLHHVFPHERAAFGRLVDAIAREHELIGYTDAVTRVTRGEIDRPYAAFSFDDGLKSCVTAAQALDERGVTACFFVCPSILGERDPARVERFCRERLRMPPLEFMSWDEVEALRARGHEIGSHTRTHPQMSELDRSQLDEEAAGSREELERRLGSVEHFSWPFGLFEHFGAAPAAAVHGAGYASCASAVRGSHAAGERWPCIRRDHVVADWPLAHVRYLLARSAERALEGGESWPAGWDPAAA